MTPANFWSPLVETHSSFRACVRPLAAGKRGYTSECDTHHAAEAHQDTGRALSGHRGAPGCGEGGRGRILEQREWMGADVVAHMMGRGGVLQKRGNNSGMFYGGHALENRWANQ